MRSLGNGLHSRGPSQSNISDLQFDDSASHHSASSQQHTGATLQSSLDGASQSPCKDSELLNVLLQQLHAVLVSQVSPLQMVT